MARVRVVRLVGDGKRRMHRRDVAGFCRDVADIVAGGDQLQPDAEDATTAATASRTRAAVEATADAESTPAGTTTAATTTPATTAAGGGWKKLADGIDFGCSHSPQNGGGVDQSSRRCEKCCSCGNGRQHHACAANEHE